VRRSLSEFAGGQPAVVVLAGYTEPTLAIVEMNPGLASRIGRTSSFRDLSTHELTMIFARLAERSRIELDETALEAVGNIIAAGGRAGGGRMARNLFERSCERRALGCAEGESGLHHRAAPAGGHPGRRIGGSAELAGAVLRHRRSLRHVRLPAEALARAAGERDESACAGDACELPARPLPDEAPRD